MTEASAWHPYQEVRFDEGATPIGAEAIRLHQVEILEAIAKNVASKETNIELIDEEGEQNG